MRLPQPSRSGAGARRQQPVVDVHRLERARRAARRRRRPSTRMCPPVMCASSAPSAVVAGGGSARAPQPLRRGEAPREQADRGALDVALDAGDLAGEAQPRHRRCRRSVVSSSFGLLRKVLRCRPPRRANSAFCEARDHAEDAHLLGVLQLGLEADHVPQRAERVVLAQLHDGVGRAPPVVRIGEADRLHRPEAQRFAARARPSPRSAGSRRSRASRPPTP